MNWFKNKTESDGSVPSAVSISSRLLARNSQVHPKSGDVSRASTPSMETFKTKRVNPRKVQACHLSFREWFKLEKHYNLTNNQFNNLEKEIPGYASTLEHIVRDDLDVDEAFTSLAKLVDPVYDPEIRARQFLDEQHWPELWDDWKEHLKIQNTARIVTSCIQREIARRRARSAWVAATTEADSLNLHPPNEAALARARAQAIRRACRKFALEMAQDGIRTMRIPNMAIRVQSLARGNRVRVRMDRYRAWLARRRQWMLEQARAREGLAYMRGLGKDPTNQSFGSAVERRVWGRTEYDSGDTGFNLGENYSILDFIDNPPQGNDYGVRTLKVKVPLKTDYDVKIATQDPNSWVGIPVSMREINRSHRDIIGPDFRTTATATYTRSKKEPVDPTLSSRFEPSYSWIPSKLVKDAVIDINKDDTQKQDTDTREDGDMVSELP